MSVIARSKTHCRATFQKTSAHGAWRSAITERSRALKSPGSAQWAPVRIASPKSGSSISIVFVRLACLASHWPDSIQQRMRFQQTTQLSHSSRDFHRGGDTFLHTHTHTYIYIYKQRQLAPLLRRTVALACFMEPYSILAYAHLKRIAQNDISWATTSAIALLTRNC